MHLCMYAVVKSIMCVFHMSTAVSASPGSHQNQPFVNKGRVSGTSGGGFQAVNKTAAY